MSASATNRLPNAGAAPRKALNLTLWFVQILLALAFLGASVPKLMGRADMVALFTALGVGQWFRYVTGILELAGAVLILVPKTRIIGAALLGAIMVCAVAVNLFIVPANVTPPLVLLLLACFVVWGRRRD